MISDVIGSKPWIEVYFSESDLVRKASSDFQVWLCRRIRNSNQGWKHLIKNNDREEERIIRNAERSNRSVVRRWGYCDVLTEVLVGIAVRHLLDVPGVLGFRCVRESLNHLLFITSL